MNSQIFINSQIQNMFFELCNYGGGGAVEVVNFGYAACGANVNRGLTY